MDRIVYEVTGMTCGGCVNQVQTVLQAFGQAVSVTLDPLQVATINLTANITQLNQSLKSIGHYQLSQRTTHTMPEQRRAWLAAYRPLFLVFGYLLLISLLVEWTHGTFDSHRFMPNLMAGFFLVFSFFKLLDLKGFANSYAIYDLLAKRVPQYGYVYPFIELALGIGYVVDGNNLWLNAMTCLVMGFSTLGVLIAVFNRQKIRCACLGVVFNLPISTVTIVEDVLMILMALWMMIV